MIYTRGLPPRGTRCEHHVGLAVSAPVPPCTRSSCVAPRSETLLGPSSAQRQALVHLSSIIRIFYLEVLVFPRQLSTVGPSPHSQKPS